MTDGSSPRDVFVIAEAGVNHNGDEETALRLIDVAAEAGANAVKFQTFRASALVGPNTPRAEYQVFGTGSRGTQRSMLETLELSYAFHRQLKSHAISRGLSFLSTAFDFESLEFLLTLGLPVLKVASGEITNTPLLWRMAKAGLPLIISTGMATLGEIEQALAVVAHARSGRPEPRSSSEVWEAWSHKEVRVLACENVTLLHCVSRYPTSAVEAQLRAMDRLRDTFSLPVGYSDHTIGTTVALAAVARGACIIEKHFTLSKSLPGPDHAISLEPQELKDLVVKVREVSAALGDGSKAPQPGEWGVRRVARQHVIAAKDIFDGHRFTREDLTTARCADGIPAERLWDMIDTPARRHYVKGEPITE